ncbi:hypothetical protein [Neomoorella humiferrea]|uniref:Bacterial type II secretion system protein F domain protein n=1 Tax=Neomoorella humiferrea TaxID=676965 RepID=A0A2T0AR21_9FIRM|nr:hypothetical protein [Moorella humiferrea]PRR71933.1 hypothetical protein MOHU_15650 [Moorella humiferrea]
MSLVLPAFFGGGIGLAAGALLLLILRLTPSARLKARLSGLVVARKPGITAKKKEEGGGRRFIVPTLGGAVFSGLIAGRMPYMLAAVPVGAALGFLAGKLAVKLYRSRTHFQRLREAAVLYESIDLFTRAGFTPRQAMELSLPLLTLLRPAVERCIASWSGGALRAIEQLGNDINLKEADVLIAVLMQIVEGGVAKLTGVMEEEALRLDELRQSLGEMRIAAKPVYSTVYIFLPVAALVGMLLGPLAFRAISMINSLRVG